MSDDNNVFFTSVFKRNYESIKKVLCNVGGARSSKSYSIAQLLAYKMRKERNKNIGICRKTMPALKMTAYKVFIDLLKEWGLYDINCHNRTEHFYQFEHTNSRIQFFSLDDPEKIKSTEFNYLWLEEANEFTYPDYITLLTRLSGKINAGEINQIFLSYNPNETNWISEKLTPQENCQLIKSTYLDNPFLDEEYIQTLKDLKKQDLNFYKIYALGEYGNNEGLIYTNYELIDTAPEQYTERVYGLDFGYNAQTALVEILINDGEVFLNEVLFETHLTNNDLIERLKDLIPNKHNEIFADSAEPARIQEIAGHGFNIHPADKNIKSGIDFVKKFNLRITKKSEILLKKLNLIRGRRIKTVMRLMNP